jgi:hypothetical protein
MYKSLMTYSTDKPSLGCLESVAWKCVADERRVGSPQIAEAGLSVSSISLLCRNIGML